MAEPPPCSPASTSRTSRPKSSPMPEWADWQFAFLLMSNGILIGLMYSLIALGFVLVYKATDAVNFAQGEFVMISVFVVVGALTVVGVPVWLSVAAALGARVAFGFRPEHLL